MIALYKVTEHIFHRFVVEQELKEAHQVEWDYLPGSNYVNSDSEIHAYLETSSWGAPTVYKISDANYQNFKSLSLVNKILQAKN